MVISIEIMFFQVRENLKNISKTNIILFFFTLAKKTPRDFAFFFSHVVDGKDRGVKVVARLRWF